MLRREQLLEPPPLTPDQLPMTQTSETLSREASSLRLRRELTATLATTLVLDQTHTTLQREQRTRQTIPLSERPQTMLVQSPLMGMLEHQVRKQLPQPNSLRLRKVATHAPTHPEEATLITPELLRKMPQQSLLKKTH